MSDETFCTLEQVSEEIARRGNAAIVLARPGPPIDTPDGAAAFALLQGRSSGWNTAVAIARRAEDQVYDNQAEALRELAFVLAENRRRTEALTAATIRPSEQQGRCEALGEAEILALAAAHRAAARAGEDPEPTGDPQPEPDPDDLSSWHRYPKVPVKMVSTHHELCLFLGGDTTSFTGDLLRLIGRADPGNLTRLAAAFPREVRAFLMWRACAPVPADTLVALLEASAMTESRRHPREH